MTKMTVVLKARLSKYGPCTTPKVHWLTLIRALFQALENVSVTLFSNPFFFRRLACSLLLFFFKCMRGGIGFSCGDGYFFFHLVLSPSK